MAGRLDQAEVLDRAGEFQDSRAVCCLEAGPEGRADLDQVARDSPAPAVPAARDLVLRMGRR